MVEVDSTSTVTTYHLASRPMGRNSGSKTFGIREAVLGRFQGSELHGRWKSCFMRGGDSWKEWFEKHPVNYSILRPYQTEAIDAMCVFCKAIVGQMNRLSKALTREKLYIFSVDAGVPCQESN